MSIGPLVHWSIGPLVHWSIGPLEYWSIGPLVECQMLSVNKVNLLSERTSGVPPVTFSLTLMHDRQTSLFLWWDSIFYDQLSGKVGGISHVCPNVGLFLRTNELFDYLADWLVFSWFVFGCLDGCLVDWLVLWFLVGWMVDWFVLDWIAGWKAGWCPACS